MSAPRAPPATSPTCAPSERSMPRNTSPTEAPSTPTTRPMPTRATTTRSSSSSTERSLLTESASEHQPRRQPALPCRRAPIGAEPGADGTHFRVWAPAHQALDLVLLEPSAGEAPDALVIERRQTIRLDAEEGGYFSA